MKYYYLCLLSFGLVFLSACDDPSLSDGFVSPELPAFSEISDVTEKKQAFSAFLMPLIEHANLQILNDRAKIFAMPTQSTDLSQQQAKTLSLLLEQYRVATNLPLEHQLAQLTVKVDLISPALVLVQAANESAWGTSRFALEGNNLFGQWCFVKGCGLVPLQRNADASHEVAKFASVYDSVYAYMLNLNRHPAYSDLRIARLEQRAHGELDAMLLVKHLGSYSERGDAYIEELSAMLRVNSELWPSQFPVAN